MDLKIGALARRTGTNTPTIRYYEKIGLMPMPSRGQGKQRSYGDDDVRRLAFIRRCRDLGLPVRQIFALTTLARQKSRSCPEARDIAHQHLVALQSRLAELKALERAVADFVEHCDASCA